MGSFPGERVVRFNARGPDALMEGKAPGQRPKLNEAQHEALVAIVESGPAPEIHGVVRWRLIDQPARIMSIGRRQRAQEFRGGAAGYYTAAIMASQVMPAMKVCVVHDPNAACWGMARNPAQTALHALRVPGRSEGVDEVRHPRHRVAEQRKRAARRPPPDLEFDGLFRPSGFWMPGASRRPAPPRHPAASMRQRAGGLSRIRTNYERHLRQSRH